MPCAGLGFSCSTKATLRLVHEWNFSVDTHAWKYILSGVIHAGDMRWNTCLPCDKVKNGLHAVVQVISAHWLHPSILRLDVHEE